MKNLEKLKEIHKDLWEKAEKKFTNEKAKNRYFEALVLQRKAKQLEKELVIKENSKKRKRRTRALILFALAILKRMSKEEFKNTIKELKQDLLAKEQKQIIDYTKYLIEEFEKNDDKKLDK